MKSGMTIVCCMLWLDRCPPSGLGTGSRGFFGPHMSYMNSHQDGLLRQHQQNQSNFEGFIKVRFRQYKSNYGLGMKVEV